MGTKYVRDEDLPSELCLPNTDESYILEIQDIYSSLPLGNDLLIQLRQTSALDFVTINNSGTKHSITINPQGISTGYYELILESYDGNSSIKSALKTDKIVLEILEQCTIENLITPTDLCTLAEFDSLEPFSDIKIPTGR